MRPEYTLLGEFSLPWRSPHCALFTAYWRPNQRREDCEAQTKVLDIARGVRVYFHYFRPRCFQAFPNAKYKKFSTQQEAEIFAFGKPLAASSTSTSQVTGASKRPTSTRKNPYDRPVPGVNISASGSPERALRHQRILQAIAAATVEWTEIYTDGACRGNGKAGSTAGVGVWFGRDHPKYGILTCGLLLFTTVTFRNLSERCPGAQTNNRAELIVCPSLSQVVSFIYLFCQAIIRALEMTSRTRKIIIKTDSKYSISCRHSHPNPYLSLYFNLQTR